MSVIIKGMKLPQHADVDGDKDTVYKCAVLAHPDNTVELVIDEIFATPYYNGHDIQRYTLTEIPIPHGRLIDADKLYEPMERDLYAGIGCDPTSIAAITISEAPTVIEAEVRE